MKLSEQYSDEVSAQVKELEALAATSGNNEKLSLQRGARRLIELLAKREVALHNEVSKRVK